MARRMFAVIVLLCMWTGSIPLADAAPARCVGLVLGGGGARGAAHIGVIEVLERERIPICRIAGTSMGSIVGGLYAAGYTPAEMVSVVGDLDWADLFSDDPARVEMPMHRKEADYRYLLNFEIGYKNGRIITPVGVVQGQKLLLLLRRLLVSTWDVDDFDELPIPFRAVSTDIVAGKEVVSRRGDLPLAIRSSMSVPGAFAPTSVDGRLLVDGGVMNNVPIDVVRGMGASQLIVVHVGTPLADAAELSNPVALLNQMVGALMVDKTDRQLATLNADDILIRPALGKLGSGEFNRCKEAIGIGRAAAEAAVPRLRSLSVSPAEWSDYQARHRQRAFDPGLVAFLEVDPAATQTSTYVDERLSTLVGEPLAVEDLEQRIGAVYGRGNYQQIDYRLQRRNGERGVLVIPADKPWGPVYGRFGFQLDDDFEGRSEYLLSAEISATNINRFGAEWRNTLWIGRIGGVRSEFYQPFGDGASVHAMPYLMGRNEDVPVFDGDGDQQLSEYRIRRRMLGIELGWSPRSYWSVSGTLERGRDDGDLRIGDPVSFPDATADYSVLKAGLSWDSLDDAQFPASGSHVSFTYDMFRPFLGGDLDSDAVRMNADWVPRFGSHVGRYHLLLGLRLASALDDDQFFETQGFLGGFLNLSGYPERSLRGNQLAYGRAVLYRRTGRLDKIFSTPFYIGASLEAGNTWASKDDVALDSLRYGGSLFIGLKTPLGPVFFGYGLADEGRDAVYLTFGSLLRPVP